jgi:phosphoglycolate phosphatase-like HAD superfamily hydrolase
VRLFSFDIDGTLEVGDPPGIIPVALLRQAKQRGYLVGTCSDRPISFQQALWTRLGLVADFTVLKHRLADVRARFAAAAYYHIGDTDADEHFARLAGFHFLSADPASHRTWGPRLFVDRGI